MKQLVFFYCLLSSVYGISQDKTNSQSIVQIWNNESIQDTIRWKALLDYFNTGIRTEDSLIYPLLDEFVEETRNKRHASWYVNSRIIEISIGNRYRNQDPEKDFIQLIQETKQLGDTILISKAYKSLELHLFYKGDYAKKLKYEIEHLNIIEVNHKHTEYYIQQLHRVGNGYERLKKYDKARDYYKRALEQATINQDLGSISGTHINIAELESTLGNDSLNQYHLEQALNYAIEAENEFLFSLIKVYLSEIYGEQGDYEKANIYLGEAIKFFTSVNHSYWLTYSYRVKGRLSYFQGSIFDAIKHTNTSLKYSEQSGSNLMISSSLEHLHKYYAEQGNFKKAYITRDRYETLMDTIFNQSQAEESATLLNQYVNDKKMLADSLERKRISELEKVEHEKELSAQSNMKYLFGTGFGFLLVIAGLLFRGFHQKRRDNEIISEQKAEVEHQKNEIEAQHQEIKDSMAYAKRIQSAILPPEKLIKKYLTKSFVWYKPKDIVAGDFYWMEPQKDRVLYAAADCTGHGVPGAMVSVICNNGLNRSTREFGLSDPGEILTKTRELVIAEFEKSEEEVKDGMDIALCSLERHPVPIAIGTVEGQAKNILKYAGAHNPLWIIRKGSTEVEEIKADKQPIGKYAELKPFTTHEVELNPGDTFYTFSDGFADQFGGEKGKKFKAKNFKALLLSIQNENMDRQKELIDEAFENWRGNLEQLDDVCVIGVRV